MILSCPACATRYVVDPRSIGTEGRKVRCARCGETWHQEAPAAEMLEPLTLMDEPPPGVAADPLLDPASPPVVTAPAMVGGGTAAAVEESMPSFITERPRPAARANLPAVAKPKRVSSVGLGWAALAAFILLVLAGGWYFAPMIMRSWPPSARLYSALGLEAASPEAALELRGTNSARGNDEAGQTVIVTGEIANVSHVRQALPQMRLSLRNAKGETIKSADFPPPKEALDPGETVPYQATIAAPDNPDDATSALVAFIR